MKFNYRNETMSISDFRKQFNISDKVTYVKKLARNTFEYNINGTLKVRLYETDILEHKSKSIILNNGGFNSILTKNRLNDILSSIFQIHYIELENYNIPCICTIKGNWYYIDKYGTKYRFFDDIEISKKTSKVINLKNSPDFSKEDKKKKRIEKLIKNYCDKINKMKELPNDSNGDCFFCHSDMFNDNEHLLTHLKEKYVMKSLIFNALKREGYIYPEFIYELEKNNKGDRKRIIMAVKKYFRYNLIK